MTKTPKKVSLPYPEIYDVFLHNNHDKTKKLFQSLKADFRRSIVTTTEKRK